MSTGPRCHKNMSNILCFMLLVFIVAWATSVFWGKGDMLKRISESWEIFIVVLGYPMWVIKRYFGARETDKKTRASVVTGQPIQNNLLANIIGAFKK